MILPGLSIVIPAFEEEATLESVVRGAAAAAREAAARREIIVVDDGSRDRTGEIARRLAAEMEGVRVLAHERNRGYGAAQRTGFAAAREPFVMAIPADGQLDLADIPRYARRMVEDPVDALVGFRPRRDGDPLARRLATRANRALLRALFGVRLRDANWVKLFRREALAAVPAPEASSVAFDAELLIRLARAGARFGEIEASYLPRRAGAATGGRAAVILRTIAELLRLRWRLWRT